MADYAVIFDVDGVLLELTSAEEELFFKAFESYGDTKLLSRDWNSYRIRNDEDITHEICERWNIDNSSQIKQSYLRLLQRALGNTLHLKAISGAAELLATCSKFATLGIATANFRKAAQLRLEQADLWHHVSSHAFGAEGGGHKSEILARALNSINLPKDRIVYVGDNINDVVAGIENKVHFIGFSENPHRLETLKAAGAIHLSSNHAHTPAQIKTLLNI